MDAESSKRKMSPPFLASIFRFSEGVFISHLREIEVPWHLVRSSLDLEPRVFGFLLIGLKPFWCLFGTYCFLVPKVFWFGPFERSKPLGVRFNKYAKFADSACFANLLSYAACRCLPKLAIWAA